MIAEVWTWLIPVSVFEHFSGDQPADQQRRIRRQRYMPPMKTDAELFEERNHIKPGDFWEEQFGSAQDDHTTISCLEEGTQFRELIQWDFNQIVVFRLFNFWLFNFARDSYFDIFYL